MPDIFLLVPWLFYATVIGISLLVGSFLNVVIYRLPIMMEREWDEHVADWQANKDDATIKDPVSDAGDQREAQTDNANETFNLATPRSACPHCDRPITAIENIPVLSYAALGGKCRGCKAPISLRYPFVELLTAALSAWVAMHFGIGLEAVAGVALTWCLVALSGIDIDKQLLPDSITLPLVWLGLFLSLFHVDSATTLFIAPSDAIAGALAGYLSLWSVYQLFKLITGKEGMGYGDFKLLAALGAWLGWQKLPVIIMLSAAVGAAFGIAMIIFDRERKGRPMPFGPWLAAAGFLAMLYGAEIMDYYLAITGLG
ncbi:MAG: A24 family peptidase [Woeseiaceae bacterium]